VKTFVSVFEACSDNEAFVRNVTMIEPGIIAVETTDGTDTIMSPLENGTVSVRTAGGEQRISGRFAVASVKDGQLAWQFVESESKK